MWMRISRENPVSVVLGLDLLRQAAQRERVTHVRATLPEHLGQRFMGVAELLDELPQAFGLLKRRQILTLEILDHRDLQRIVVPYQRRDRFQSSHLGCPPAPLAGHDKVPVTLPLDDDRLQQPARPDRLGQLGHRMRIEVAARLLRVGPHGRYRDGGQDVRLPGRI